MERVFAIAVLALLTSAVTAQTKPPISNLSRPTTTTRSQFDPALRLTIENPKLGVFRLELPAHGSAAIGRELRDYVVVAVSGGTVEVGSPGNAFTMEMTAGEPA